MNQLKNERGIAFVLEIVLVAVVLSAIGFAVYFSMHPKKAPTAAASPTPSPKVSPTPTPTSSHLKKPADQFDVPELGFKMTLPEGLEGLKYTYELDIPGEAEGVQYKISTVSFTTKALEAADPGCSAKNLAIGGFAKYPFDPRTKDISDIGQVVKLGQSYLAFIHPQSVCSTDSKTTDIENSSIDLLAEAFDSITPQ